MTFFDPGARGLRSYALIGPNGWHYIGLHVSEEDCWRIALGWPTVGEVNSRKADGYFVTEITCSYTREEK